MLRLIMLFALVILAAGATIWVAVLAAETGHFDSATLMSLMPLVMLAAIAVRALRSGPRR